LALPAVEEQLPGAQPPEAAGPIKEEQLARAPPPGLALPAVEEQLPCTTTPGAAQLLAEAASDACSQSLGPSWPMPPAEADSGVWNHALLLPPCMPGQPGLPGQADCAKNSESSHLKATMEAWGTDPSAQAAAGWHPEVGNAGLVGNGGQPPLQVQWPNQPPPRLEAATHQANPACMMGWQYSPYPFYQGQQQGHALLDDSLQECLRAVVRGRTLAPRGGGRKEKRDRRTKMEVANAPVSAHCKAAAQEVWSSNPPAQAAAKCHLQEMLQQAMARAAVRGPGHQPPQPAWAADEAKVQSAPNESESPNLKAASETRKNDPWTQALEKETTQKCLLQTGTTKDHLKNGSAPLDPKAAWEWWSNDAWTRDEAQETTQTWTKRSSESSDPKAAWEWYWTRDEAQETAQKYTKKSSESSDPTAGWEWWSNDAWTQDEVQERTKTCAKNNSESSDPDPLFWNNDPWARALAKEMTQNQAPEKKTTQRWMMKSSESWDPKAALELQTETTKEHLKNNSEPSDPNAAVELCNNDTRDQAVRKQTNEWLKKVTSVQWLQSAAAKKSRMAVSGDEEASDEKSPGLETEAFGPAKGADGPQAAERAVRYVPCGRRPEAARTEAARPEAVRWDRWCSADAQWLPKEQGWRASESWADSWGSAQW